MQDKSRYPRTVLTHLTQTQADQLDEIVTENKLTISDVVRKGIAIQHKNLRRNAARGESK